MSELLNVDVAVVVAAVAIACAKVAPGHLPGYGQGHGSLAAVETRYIYSNVRDQQWICGLAKPF